MNTNITCLIKCWQISVQYMRKLDRRTYLDSFSLDSWYFTEKREASHIWFTFNSISVWNLVLIFSSSKFSQRIEQSNASIQWLSLKPVEQTEPVSHSPCPHAQNDSTWTFGSLIVQWSYGSKSFLTVNKSNQMFIFVDITLAMWLFQDNALLIFLIIL